MVEKFKALIDFLIHNKPILFIGIAIYVALVIKEYSKIKMGLEVLRKGIEEANDAEIKETRSMYADLRSRGFYDSNVRTHNENEIKRKWSQKKCKLVSQINYHKILLWIAWIPLISGLSLKKVKE